MGFFAALIGNAGVISVDEVQKQYEKLLAENEEIEIAFKLIRDLFIFTNKRMILVNKQGITAKKVNYLSVNYKSISRFSIETAGHFDLDAELKIWIANETEPFIQKKFNKQVNVYDVQRVLANYVLD